MNKPKNLVNLRNKELKYFYVFIEAKLPEQQKHKIKKMSGELLNDEVVDNDPKKLYGVQVFHIIIDKLSMSIED